MPALKLKKYLSGTISKDKWGKIGLAQRSGIFAPLFSVYSKESVGIADFLDLRLLIDWAGETGNSIIQLLPMNETGSVFCPYDSVSSFALEPSYLCLRDLPAAKNKTVKASIQDIKNNFPCTKGYVDYGIKEEKLRLLGDIYRLDRKADSPEFARFKEKNKYWLLDFALYKAIKDYHKGSAWFEWEDKFKNREKPVLNDFLKTHAREVAFQEWVQWQLYQQFKSAKEYAKGRKVLLKGDLPILVSRDSADVWAHREFFKLEFASGAPPDAYCAKGQRWGMPTYNREVISQGGYEYLKERLRYAGNFYDLLRIDHVVGLFRIWSIPFEDPLENRGLNGVFDPSDEKLWRESGLTILTAMLKNTDMLLCAEDLGVIPKVCPDTLKELGIPGNDVQRWVKDWDKGHDFLEPSRQRELSVSMLSTHDTSNWPAWWENEAGTVDQELFIRKCLDHRKINFSAIKDRLFDPSRSRQGRLRWLDTVDSVNKLVSIMGRGNEELADFIELYRNSFGEKEKLWRQLGLTGKMREKCDREIMRAALKMSLRAGAVFCINSIIDWLYPGGIFKGDPYQHRINTPGTVSQKNWSLMIPLSLEELLVHKVTKEIRKMVSASGRI